MPHVYFNLLPKFPKAAGTPKEFGEWDTRLQEEYPVRYKINSAIHNTVNVIWGCPKRKLTDMRMAFMYRYISDHKYNTVVIGKPDYYEPFDRILRAPFTVFKEFMDDIYSGNSHVQWHFDDSDVNESITKEYIDKKNALWTEMEALYHWWTVEHTNRCAELEKTYPLPEIPEEWGLLAIVDEDYKDEPLIVTLKECYDMRRQVEAYWDAQDEEMLIRLAKIRLELWD